MAIETAYFIYYSVLTLYLFVPSLLYTRRNHTMAKFCLRMVVSGSYRTFYCYMLLLVVIVIHSVFFQTHIGDWGLMVSTFVMLAMFRTSLTEKALVRISDSRRWLRWLTISALLISAIPLFFTLGLTLTVIVTGACFYPSRRIRDESREYVMRQYRMACEDGEYADFIDEYFDEGHTEKTT